IQASRAVVSNTIMSRVFERAMHLAGSSNMLMRHRRVRSQKKFSPTREATSRGTVPPQQLYWGWRNFALFARAPNHGKRRFGKATEPNTDSTKVDTFWRVPRGTFPWRRRRTEIGETLLLVGARPRALRDGGGAYADSPAASHKASRSTVQQIK